MIPTDVSGLKIWFDASQLGLADGASVSPWPNLADAALPGLIEGSPSPKVRADALFGHPVVRFKVNEGRLRIYPPTLSTGVHQNWTILYVGRMVGPALGRIVTSVHPNAANLLIGWWNGYWDIAYDNGFIVPPGSNFTGTDWKMYSADGNSTIPRSRLFGGSGPTLGLLGSLNGGAGWGNAFAINGYGADADTSESCDCEVAEAMLYDRQLLGTERQALETYLYERWITGTGWPAPGPPPFPTNSTLLDDFERASLGANWTQGVYAGENLQIYSNQHLTNIGGWGSATYNVQEFGPDIEHICTINTGGTFEIAWKVKNFATGAPDGYFIHHEYSGTPYIQLWKMVAGSQSSIGAQVPVTYNGGDKIGVEQIGSTINVYKQTGGVGTWDLIMTRTDTTFETVVGRFGYLINGALLDNMTGGTRVLGSGLDYHGRK